MCKGCYIAAKPFKINTFQRFYIEYNDIRIQSIHVINQHN